MPMTTVVISRQLLSWNENDELKESNYITMELTLPAIDSYNNM
jgi:hypothetical protein